MSEKLIGILAGMGPRSTAPFVDMVIDQCQLQYGAKYDEEFPKIMIYSLPTPFYIDRPINHELMEKTIIAGLQKLESTGVSFIAMPCNSAHIYFENLRKSIKVPLLNIVDETIKMLPGGSQRVTLFSTGSTFDSGIYQKGIKAGGHEFVFRNEWQIMLNKLIQGIKMDKASMQNVSLWESLMEALKQEAVENIIIACTDLNVVLGKDNSAANFIDSSKCLAVKTISEYMKL